MVRKGRKMRTVIHRPRDLFEAEEPTTALSPVQRSQMLPLLQAMLIEVSTATAVGRRRVTKITPEHLARGAYIYIRQSTADQLLHNHESRRRQYGLADRARHLGWQDVVVIDDDLGRSGSGVSRPGFERLLAAICEGRVGSVSAIEVSRLARNGRRCQRFRLRSRWKGRGGETGTP
jgi:hypothetical protein